MKATIFSIYFSNIPNELIRAQRVCIERLLPKGWTFWQYHYTAGKPEYYHHAQAMKNCVESIASENDVIMFLDIDCIPLTKTALPFLADQVAIGEGKGLVGVVQRANHIQNNKHLYVGPSCMAFSKAYYKEMGSPSFAETGRGDVAEELTYRWTEKSGHLAPAGKNPNSYSSNIHFIWPFHVAYPLWDLDFDIKFGIGTTYGAAGKGPLFYHSFNARNAEMQKIFIDKCTEVSQKSEEKVSA